MGGHLLLCVGCFYFAHHVGGGYATHMGDLTHGLPLSSPSLPPPPTQCECASWQGPMIDFSLLFFFFSSLFSFFSSHPFSLSLLFLFIFSSFSLFSFSFLSSLFSFFSSLPLFSFSFPSLGTSLFLRRLLISKH